jgi:glycosyltransferase involved in cell wall biosynthesis
MISGHAIPARVTPVEERIAHPIVLWAGNLGANKRPERFIDLARLGQNTPLQFVMIGGHANLARSTALFTNIPNNLKWPGKIPFDDALSHFDRAAFFVCTSAQEGFPNTFIQAWLRGVPVMSFGVDPDGVIARNGLGFVNSDPAKLIEQMLSLAADASRYRAMSASIRRFAEANHSVEAMCDHFQGYIGGDLVRLKTDSLRVQA